LLIDGRDYYRAFYQAARTAQRYILIAGWQFDSTARLLRGDDAQEAEGEIQFLPFLNELCERNLSLSIYILAWDFSVLFSLEREWWQEWIFNATTNERLQFRFDNRHPFGASHHQKFVVIDGCLAFVGGADLCARRWDDRIHCAEHPERVEADALSYGPYHEVQSYHVGPVAADLTELLLSRWRQPGGDERMLLPPAASRSFRFDASLALAAARVAVSRTQPAMGTPPQEPVREIRQLYVDAIAAAEQIIYIENQYFSSQAVYTALQQRMQAPHRSRLTIVMMLPKRAEALTEDLALGFAQAKLLRALHETARRTGHKLGVYYTAARGADGREKPTYIHSKLLLVDDCFLSVGSANTTNRSMGFDTELNVSWEASAARDDALRQSIRRVRVSLLAEHCGLPESTVAAELSQTTGLVEYLDRLCEAGVCRLRRHPMDTLFDEIPLLRLLKPEDFVLDPEHSLFEGLLPGVSVSSSFRPAHSSLLPLHNLTANEQRVSAVQAARPPDGAQYGSAAPYEKGSWWFWSFVAVVLTLLGALFWSDFNASFAGKAAANGYGLAPPFSSPHSCAGCNDRARFGVRSHTRGVNRYAIPH
jgi:phosphatidylserine/phosphatidylglycerophosphate/cardiolipin synthase-like enzyme